MKTKMINRNKFSIVTKNIINIQLQGIIKHLERDLPLKILVIQI